MKTRTKALAMLVTSMLIFGSIGLFVRYISLPSSVIAFVRALIGLAFLLCVIVIKKTQLSWAAIQKNLLILIFSGAAIGFNWILLFESYRYTSVAVSTLCYYMAPVIITFLAPFILKEKVSVTRILCTLIALIGVALISGILNGTPMASGEIKGILFGLGAATLYASAILLNKHLRCIEAMDRTICQMAVAAIVLIPYNFVTCELGAIALKPITLFLLLIIGIIHTGLAYYLYFGSMEDLSGQTIAITSYVDPVVAVIISALLLREPFDIFTVLGAIAILGAAVISELPHKEDVTHDN